MFAGMADGDGEKASGGLLSVDVLFASVAAVAAPQALGIIMTGMGRDGAAGLLEMRRAGAKTLGESEASCLVYGMSEAAKDLGAVEVELDMEHLAAEIVRH
jgi:two-component system chemotaxis response regulator CheB